MDSAKSKALTDFIAKSKPNTECTFEQLLVAMGGGDVIDAAYIVSGAVMAGVLEQFVRVTTPAGYVGEYPSILDVPNVILGRHTEMDDLRVMYRTKG